MHNLGSTNTEHDSQNFQTSYPLRHLWVEAAAALLDGCKVKARCVGNRLKETSRLRIGGMMSSKPTALGLSSGNDMASIAERRPQ
jgi:hypothetical protein